MNFAPFVSAAAVAAAFAAPAVLAATPGSYAALNARSAAACERASGLRDAKAGATIRYSDAFLVDARTVSGVWPQPHMRGAKATVLCLYDRRSGRAETQEMVAAEQPGAPRPPAEPGRPIRDIWWSAREIGGLRPLEGAEFRLMLGGDGKIAGRSGCNNFSVNYMLTDTALTVYQPSIGTRMMCAPAVMAQETRFRDILERSVRAATTADGALLLSAADGRSLRFVRDRSEGDAPLAFRNIRCGLEEMRVSFGRDAAVVEFRDGRRVKLEADEDAPRGLRAYTDGRLTLTEARGQDRAVTFARGRMAPVDCEAARD